VCYKPVVHFYLCLSNAMKDCLHLNVPCNNYRSITNAKHSLPSVLQAYEKRNNHLYCYRSITKEIKNGCYNLIHAHPIHAPVHHACQKSSNLSAMGECPFTIG
jgi:hypothetical protein